MRSILIKKIIGTRYLRALFFVCKGEGGKEVHHGRSTDHQAVLAER